MTKARKRNHHLEKRGNSWYIIVGLNGRRIRKSLQTSSLSEARRLRNESLRRLLLDGVLLKDPSESKETLFGEFAKRWAEITAKKVKLSTMRDYRTSMTSVILPRFGDRTLREISYLDIEEMISGLDCSPKRVNNILVPLRSLFKMAHKSGFVEKNVMDIVENRKTPKPTIHPLSIDEVTGFLDAVNPFYRPFFEVSFFTGMRGGEMAAPKWDNVDLEKKTIRVTETRVYGEEGMPKTKSSYRTIVMLPMVLKALQEQAARTMFKSKYVFLNTDGKPLNVETLRKNAWSRGLKRAKIPYRPMIQTRHTFATMMISAGENVGWVQRMMGHSSLQMIVDNYFSFIPNLTHQDGTLFVQEYEKKRPEVPQKYHRPDKDFTTYRIN